MKMSKLLRWQDFSDDGIDENAVSELILLKKANGSTSKEKLSFL